MKYLLLAAASLAPLSACALTPDEPAPGWAEEQLRQSPPGAPPGYIERLVLLETERVALEESFFEVVAARDVVRAAAARLETPTPDTAEFVVEARARAIPPAQ